MVSGESQKAIWEGTNNNDSRGLSLVSNKATYRIFEAMFARDSCGERVPGTAHAVVRGLGDGGQYAAENTAGRGVTNVDSSTGERALESIFRRGEGTT
jgi:hypothetical protein|tara:strand:- start:6249 stop:6542 length:294 start_codon:yes stop_codon:yes gene_type:complete